MKTPSQKIRWLIFIGIAFLAFAIRLPQLGSRPMHTDEAVNAYITGNLLAGEAFHYDPQDKHGPLLFLIAKPLTQLLGAKNFSQLTEIELRLTPVIIGSMTILLFGAAVEFFGFLPCLIAALLFAVAPLPVYYSRYFIHETLFVATTFALLLAGLRWFKSNSVSAAALTGLAGGCAFACKETSVIHFFALAGAMTATWFVARNNPAQSFRLPALKTILIALAFFCFSSVLLFTWFGRNWAALADLFHAAVRFTARAGGEGHEKPPGYYFSILDFTFVLYLLALAGIYAVACEVVGGSGRARFALLIYGVLIAGIYSAIPYKQPWLALNLWLLLALLAGLGVEAIAGEIKNSSGRWFIAGAAAVLLSALGTQTKALVFDRPADEKNPYAYAHTSEDILDLAGKVEEISSDRKIKNPRLAVIAKDCWPLPWYLRKFSQVGYWQPGQAVGAADFFITTTEIDDSLQKRLEHFRPNYFGVRPGVLIVLWSPPRTNSP